MARDGHQTGVTLIELLIVVALIGLLVGISFPSIGAGVDSLRMRSAAEQIVNLFNAALNRAERRQQAIELAVWPKQNRLTLRSTEPGFERALDIGEGVSIAAVHPELPQANEGPRRFLLLPGGAAPRIAIELRSVRGARRVVSLDPITGVPRIETAETAR